MFVYVMCAIVPIVVSVLYISCNTFKMIKIFILLFNKATKHNKHAIHFGYHFGLYIDFWYLWLLKSLSDNLIGLLVHQRKNTCMFRHFIFISSSQIMVIKLGYIWKWRPFWTPSRFRYSHGHLEKINASIMILSDSLCPKTYDQILHLYF